MLKFRACRVIKLFLIIAISIFNVSAYSQTSSESVVKKESAEILERKISLHWNGGTLPKLLKELSARENINFAYSREKTNHISISKQVFNSERLSSLLNTALQYTGYTFIIIGKTIAIVEDKNNVAPEKPEESDSIPSNYSATETYKKNSSHIYPESPVASRLPFHIRIKLRKIYRKELRLARKHENDSTKQQLASDSIRQDRFFRSSFNKSGIYFSANAGPAFGILNHASDFPDWKNKFDFNSEIKPSITVEVSGGIMFKRFILESGIRFNKLNIENSYTKDPKKKKITSFSEMYRVITVPVNILYYKKYTKTLIGAGAGIGLSYIKREAPKNKMRHYYDRLKGPEKEKYTESSRKISPAFNLKVFADYQITDQWSLSGNVYFSIPLLAYYTNSVYRLSPYLIGVQVGLSYWFF